MPSLRRNNPTERARPPGVPLLRRIAFNAGRQVALHLAPGGCDLTRTRTVTWMHPIAEVVAALRGAGMALDWLNEHPRVARRMVRCLERDADSLWTWPTGPGCRWPIRWGR